MVPGRAGESPTAKPAALRAATYAAWTSAGAESLLAWSPTCSRSPDADTELDTTVRPVGDRDDRRSGSPSPRRRSRCRSRAADPSATDRVLPVSGSPDGPGRPATAGSRSRAPPHCCAPSCCPPTSRWPPGRESRSRRTGRSVACTGAVAGGADDEADDEAAASGVDPCEVHPAVAPSPSTSTAASTTARPRGAAAAVARDGLCGVDIGDLGRGGVQRIDDRPKRQKADMWNVPTVPTRRARSGPCATLFTRVRRVPSHVRSRGRVRRGRAGRPRGPRSPGRTSPPVTGR